MNVDNTAPATQGIVLQMQDYSIHDGDGVRTTIFLAGCALRCQWCANPETWTATPKLAYYPHKCKGCQTCVGQCPQQLDPRAVTQATQACDHCSLCVKACPSRALSLACTPASVDEVVAKIKRDELFFRYTDGGVTFSGGEPFMQPDFIRAVIEQCEPLGISFWAETCGHFNWRGAADLFPHFDHIFFDLKVMDSAKHKAVTGLGNEQILKNVKRIYDLGVPMTIRIPFIPEVNGDEANLRATAEFMQQNLAGCAIELLPYHELGKAKYTAFKMLDDFHSYTVPSSAMLEWAYGVFGEYGIISHRQ